MVWGLVMSGTGLGRRSGAAVVGGGIAMLVGLIGFVELLSMPARLSAQEPEPARHQGLVLASALLMAAGGAAVLMAGVVRPLGNLKARMTSAIATQDQKMAELHQSHAELLQAAAAQHQRTLELLQTDSAQGREALEWQQKQAEWQQKQVEWQQKQVELLDSSRDALLRIAEIQDAEFSYVRARQTLESVFRLSMVRGQMAQTVREILSEPKYQDPRSLSQYEFHVSSQTGEDGIIDEIFRRIGTTNRYFIEFGVGDGTENNSVFLLRQGWSGLWMDADSKAVAKTKKDFEPQIDDGKLTVLETFISAENIEDLFERGGVPEEPDLLSIDLDRNDYYIWEKLSRYRPRVVIIEYNAGLPASMSWVVPYDTNAYGPNPMGNGNGASLKALEELGTKKGYSLVGCNLAGVNAFFVRDDLLGDHFSEPYTAEHHYEPFRFHHLRYLESY